MKFRPLLITILLVVAAAFAAWLFWQRPERTEMARNVPAETLVYLEANDLPAALRALTETEAWQKFAPAYGIEQNYGGYSWLSQFLANSNLGSTDSIVFGRAQIAVALLSVETGSVDDTLKIKPRFAVVIETKTSQSAAQSFVEKQIGDYARKQFGEIRVEKTDKDAAAWTYFRSAVNEEQKLFTVVFESLIIAGNDETAVQSCLDARRGKRASLAANANLNEMRARTEAANAFAFGLVTPDGVKKLAQVGAIAVAGQISDAPETMSLVAQSLPPFVEKSIAAIGWSAKAVDGKIEDCFFVQLPPDLSARLREPLAVSNQNKTGALKFLPTDVYSVTTYNLKDPAAAWRGTIFALTTKLDVLSAAGLSQTANRLLEPYGAANPVEFLSAAGNESVTARLSENTNETVAIVSVKDRNKLETAIAPGLKNPSRGASFVGELVLLGEKTDVERCLANVLTENFAASEIGRKFVGANFSNHPPIIKTFTRDGDAAEKFIKLFARSKTAPDSADLKKQFYAASETRFIANGFERRTQSAFGFVGTLATSFAGDETVNR